MDMVMLPRGGGGVGVAGSPLALVDPPMESSQPIILHLNAYPTIATSTTAAATNQM